ncbi:MAG: hypothetical protein HQL09_03110 [Nitrospirae bacterium]|nr:hypothetical protein [Nitrospirota bacterium]
MQDRSRTFKFYLLFFVLLFILCSLLSDAYAADNDKKPALQFSRDHDISQIKPRKPVKIKLHRTAKGEYQWDITGDNADDIMRADKRLRKLLETETNNK